MEEFESDNVAFFGRVPESSFISSVPVAEGFYRMVGPNGGELFPGVACVDIAKEDLIRFGKFVEFFEFDLDFGVVMSM